MKLLKGYITQACILALKFLWYQIILQFNSMHCYAMAELHSIKQQDLSAAVPALDNASSGF